MSAGIRPVPSVITVETLGESFTSVVERYQGPLIQFLYGMVGNREQAEDLAQDTLIKAYEAMERRRSGQEFSAGWLFRIARNTAIDALRRKRLISWLPFGEEHESAVSAALPRSGPAGEDFAGTLADRELIQQVLRRLPDRYRACLLLRTVVGMSNGEIAETLGMSVRNVNTTLFRARERFRQVFTQLENTTAVPSNQGCAITAVDGPEPATLHQPGTAEGGAE
ncbi:MAG TPA: sigma-70 family RNA polymerase sigma factor [Chloroflexota bacterium]|jgi:RNA polymerase sigma-70 factor (ECF subfamily)|nr:sigma-70 family RNA polymerase sigma factor [Chloroflexota bacterium]